MHAGIIKPPGLIDQCFNRFPLGKAQTFTRVETVDELNLIPLGHCDQLDELSPLRLGVRIAPAFPMVRIVFGRVKIHVHTAPRAKLEQRSALGHHPWRTEKAFDNAAAFEALIE